jgi:hypothetical protein
MADVLGQQIDGRDRDDHHQQDSADVGVVELADGDKEILTDAAGADKADNRARPHVDLEAEQRIAGKVGQDLRQGGKRTASTKRPPLLRTPSTGFMSMFSTTSVKSLPRVPKL